jgi:O-antigen ligase
MEEWGDIIRIKLPLLILPLAFAGSWQLEQKQWKMLALVFIFLIFAGTCWSIAQYLADTTSVNAAYLKAKSIPAPLENDHIRFSWLVAAAILCEMMLLSMKEHRRLKIVLWVLNAWFVVYLHILSARTGLLCLYIILLFYVLWQAWRNRRSVKIWIALAALFLLPFLAWLLLPTFQNRIRYIRYDLSYARSGSYLPGANDGSRLLSLRAGWEGLKEQPLGTGAGDVFDEANRWYDAHVPRMLSGDRLYPSSEWLIYGRTAGWPGVLVFTGIMLLPFFHPTRRCRFYWMALNAIAAASFIFDIGLEVQFGVFIYAFTVLWWWKWLNQNPSSES